MSLDGQNIERRASRTGGRRAGRRAATLATLVVAAMLVLGVGRGDAQTGGGLAVEPATEGGAGVLKVKNRTPFVVIMHVGGVRVGWMRPYRTGVIRGLNPGYHKLYAHTQQGTMSWGPKDVWVPGSWNLVH